MPSIEDTIRLIAEDHQSGASVLTEKALDCLEAFADRSPTNTLRDDLLRIAKEIVQAQPDMASLFSVCNEVLSVVAALNKKGASPKDLCRMIKEHVQKIRHRLIEASEKITAIGFTLIQEGDIILTHSCSSSVKNMLVAIHKMGKTLQVVVTESRPGFEGRRLARGLGREGIHTTLIVDSAAGRMMESAHHVIVGADRITEDFFINKIGTLSLLLCAKHNSRDCYVVCDTTKFVPRGLMEMDGKDHPKEEVLQESYPNVSIKNPYFEETPLSLVKGIICEKGLLTPKEVASHINVAGQEYNPIP